MNALRIGPAALTPTQRSFGSRNVSANHSRPIGDWPQGFGACGETNAASGSCPSGAGSGALPNNNVLRCFSEFLPTAAYTPSSMTFRLTARDQVATGGGTHYADVVLTLDKTKGPFLVSSPNTAVTYAGGSSQTVTWTSGMDTLSANVKISLDKAAVRWQNAPIATGFNARRR